MDKMFGFRIDEELLKKFKIICLEKDIPFREMMEILIRDFVESVEKSST